MEARMQILRIFLTAGIVVGMLAAHPGHAGGVIVGVNAWYRPPGMLQEEFIKQLADNGVKTIRMGLAPRSVDFIIQAYRHGVGTLAWVGSDMGSKKLSELNPEFASAWFK